MHLEGVYIVAGAGGLIGKVVTARLLAAGASVMALDLDRHALASVEKDAVSGRFAFQVVDVADASSVKSAIQSTCARFGRIDGAVNCTYPRGRNYGRHVFDIEYQDFANSVSLHLGAYFLFMQKCAEYAKSNGAPFSLVNFSSVYGSIAPRFEIYENTNMTMPAEYSAIKAGVQNLTRYFAAYMKGTAFRANCLSPGGIIDQQPEVFQNQYRNHCLTKGMLDADDVVSATLFLLSNHAQYITGQIITVDDGFSL